MNIVHNKDCMLDMINMADNEFDLAIVDPPYGIKCQHKNGKVGGDAKGVSTMKYKIFDDSKIPPKRYFDLLQRVSKHQIIWGGNYFIENLKNTPCFIVWDKENGKTDFADCELAWTNFKTATRLFKYKWNGMLQKNMKNKEKRIHPTQKPVDLYRWLLSNYAQDGWKILDTHVGSGSSRIACYDMGFDFVGYEIDGDYWKAQEERFKIFTDQNTFKF